VLHPLAVCLTADLANIAAARRVKLTEVRSTVTGDIDLNGIVGLSPDARNGYQQITVRFTIKGDAPAETLRELVEQSRARSAVAGPGPVRPCTVIGRVALHSGSAQVDEHVGNAEDRAPVIEQRLCDRAHKARRETNTWHQRRRMGLAGGGRCHVRGLGRVFMPKRTFAAVATCGEVRRVRGIRR